MNRKIPSHIEKALHSDGANFEKDIGILKEVVQKCKIAVARGNHATAEKKAAEAYRVACRIERTIVALKEVELALALSKIGKERGLTISNVSDAALYHATLQPCPNKGGGLGFSQAEIAHLISNYQPNIAKRIKVHKEQALPPVDEEKKKILLSGDPLEIYKSNVEDLINDLADTKSADTKFKIRKEIAKLSGDIAVKDAEAKDAATDVLINKFINEIPEAINEELRKLLHERGVNIQIDIREQIQSIITGDEEIAAFAAN